MAYLPRYLIISPIALLTPSISRSMPRLWPSSNYAFMLSSRHCRFHYSKCRLGASYILGDEDFANLRIETHLRIRRLRHIGECLLKRYYLILHAKNGVSRSSSFGTESAVRYILIFPAPISQVGAIEHAMESTVRTRRAIAAPIPV
ncbi:hypothetical protein F4805DRAFT_339325 [Annulohypoxylon moriforme]|nr:hypothetical protein F4805DRAFT_339325 [Annulohypoxylon moriforme]